MIVGYTGVCVAQPQLPVKYQSTDTLQSTTTPKQYIRRQRCKRYDRGSLWIGTVGCDTPPTMTAQQIIQTLRPYIQDVTSEYDAGSRVFDYEPSELMFGEGFELLIANARESIVIQDELMSIPKLLIAYDQLQDLTIVASTRDTTIYGPCRKQNYDLAMTYLDGTVLEPQEMLNMNTLISNKPGYCTGGGAKYLFYSGVCGGSTQLFWNAVLHPNLDVVQRHAHGKWYAGFYGSTVMGDDSSIYENSKKLIIQNTSESPIAFVTFVRPRDGNTVLLSVQRAVGDWQTRVTKTQTGERSARLTSRIVSDDEGVLSESSWDSHYYGIDTSIDETAGQGTI